MRHEKKLDFHLNCGSTGTSPYTPGISVSTPSGKRPTWTVKIPEPTETPLPETDSHSTTDLVVPNEKNMDLKSALSLPAKLES